MTRKLECETLLTFRRNDIVISRLWLSLKIVMLSETNQTHKEPHPVIPFVQMLRYVKPLSTQR